MLQSYLSSIICGLITSFCNSIVPHGSFGLSKEGRRAEKFALCVRLAVWIPLYILVILLLLIFSKTGWFVTMIASTSMQPYFEAPSIMLCTLDPNEDSLVNSLRNQDFLMLEEIMSFNKTDVYILLRSQGYIGYSKALIRRCGMKCFCFDTSEVSYSCHNTDFMAQRLYGVYLLGTSQCNNKQKIRTPLTFSGRYNMDFLELWMFHHIKIEKSMVIKVGLYSPYLSYLYDGFPRNLSWNVMRFGDATIYLLRLTRINIEDFTFHSLIKTILSWSDRSIPQGYYTYNIQSGRLEDGTFDNLEFARESLISICSNIEISNYKSATVLHIEAASKFTREVHNIGQSMSLVVFIGWLIILIVLVNNVGVFHICFRRKQSTIDNKSGKIRLRVTGVVKAASCYLLSEDHN
ncbi:uncharacterized protein CMU_005470 [Cryptosporidium muris RN66]|uniref:Uncharacterized protein n=1 Tax=Cryptosporidium muris (strain RN66) TaxID=441375 RepID=B6AHC9_CRYMR|nr:uncharacterized protein CMU_005470 [Cryptosporidium muris RN66]EEA07624.1 hypothetical protein, conserved [Cryptosporidium muris RN66]|eukprot:XP_002141973.1 hypothetical protein [Cryptosporidium muris RN66]